MLTLKNVIGLLVGIALLTACGSPASAENAQNAQTASVECEGTTMTVDGGHVECDGDSAIFIFADETTSFACKPEGDTLTCDTGKGTIFTITAPELPTPTPYPTYTVEELAQIEEESSSDDVVHSLTGFYDCGIYSVGVSTWEELGGGDATCGADNVTFTITLPVAIDQVWCARSVYGWSCGLEKQSFWFFLLPTW